MLRYQSGGICLHSCAGGDSTRHATSYLLPLAESASLLPPAVGLHPFRLQSQCVCRAANSDAGGDSAEVPLSRLVHCILRERLHTLSLDGGVLCLYGDSCLCRCVERRVCAQAEESMSRVVFI